jgi:hypothetical protein
MVDGGDEELRVSIESMEIGTTLKYRRRGVPGGIGY